MRRKIERTILLTLFSLTLIHCKQSLTNTVKFQPTDPFKNVIVQSKTFNIDSKLDNVVEGENGTVVVCPKGCFKNKNGEIVEANVKIELSEALTLEEMLLSNLTTTSSGKLLETDGMIYFNATSNGEQLAINKDNPIHIEIPTAEKKAGMMAYKGIRDAKGNMDWVEPKPLDNYLVTVDINSLDFLPPGFQIEVDKGMPFRNYKTATQNLTDSLYYNLSVFHQNDLISENIRDISYNEPYYNKNKKVENKINADISYVNKKVAEVIKAELEEDSTAKIYSSIDPAIIKVIKSEKYQNTLISTREFEARLKVIFKSCRNSVLEIYIQNLDKNLYELDSMAASALAGTEGAQYVHQDFLNFSRQKLTKVKHADKYAELLKGYFKTQFAKVKSELEKEKEKVIEQLADKNKDAQNVVDKYKKLLMKREKYRMETYGFNWTETGWVNIDNGTLPKDWGSQPLEVEVVNGKQFDRVYTYVVYSSIKSLYRLNTTDNKLFYAGNEQDKEMLMPKKQLAHAIAIGYKDELPSIAVKEFETGSETNFSLSLSPTTLNKVKDVISPYENYGNENSISKDLQFMAKLYKDEKRKKELLKENEFVLRLWNIAFPCLAPEVDSSSEVQWHQPS